MVYFFKKYSIALYAYYKTKGKKYKDWYKGT